MPSQSAITHRLAELNISHGSDYELSATDRDLLERALNHYAVHCSNVELELAMLKEPAPSAFYRRQRDRCRDLRDIFEMSSEVVAREVGAA